MLRKVLLITFGIIVGVIFHTKIIEWIDEGYRFIQKHYGERKEKEVSVVSSTRLQGTQANYIVNGNSQQGRLTTADFKTTVHDSSGILLFHQIPSLKQQETSMANAGGRHVHVIKRGETLIGIGKEYSIDPKNLARWNGIPYNKNVRPHDTLRLSNDGSIPISKKLLRHIVRTGESLSEIALQYGISMNVLRCVNNLQEDKIVIGKILTVDPYVFVKVKNGQTLSNIAAKFKVSLLKLIAENDIRRPDELSVGTLIKVNLR